MQPQSKIILIGLGKVGREVLKQLQACDLNFEITALADSSACLVGQPLSTDLIKTALQFKSTGQKLADLLESQPLSILEKYFTKNSIIVDISAVQNLDWSVALKNDCKLVFANKNAHSAPWLQAASLFNQPGIRYESTVGAGLPVIATLRSMINSGDQITRIEGVMSGTLGFLCSQLEAGMSYSQAVRQAFDSGYTEPDPRDDLSGFDVLRKALILGRTAGWKLEQNDFSVQPLFDDRLVGISVPEFFQNTQLLDETYAQQIEAASKEGRVLRYLASITPQGGKIGLLAVERNSTLGSLQGPGNYFAFYSQRYNEIPLVIAGPGAGIEVTANGVLNDIIALLS
ncbi:MAG: homoserine dehydrogenase [Anaerolineaceae bacterium]|nr:homoserine dehydrogenase [Anaerolineaceae bacterium]